MDPAIVRSMPLGPRGEPQRFVPFGNYLLDELIAEGGMAKVYRARLRGIGGFEKPLVVKLIHDHLAQDTAFVDLFVQEAHTLVRLGHPHIVTVYELGIVDGTYFIAMDRIEGAALSDLRQDGPFDPKEAAHIVAQVADALSYAHDRHGLVHRDITPRNILIDDTGHTHLVDFGIAAPQGQSATFGSPGYVAPELLEGQGASPQSDLFSLGVVLARCLGSEADGPLQALAERLRSPKPTARPENAKAVAEELRRWLAEAAPEGAAALLAGRVQRWRDQQRQRPLAPKADGTENVTPHTPVAKTPTTNTKHTQSLATSPLLKTSATEALPRPVEAPQSDRAPESPSSGNRPTQSPPSGSRPSDTEADTPKTEPIVAPTQPKRRRLPWAIAALLLLAFGAFAFFRTPDPPTSGEPRTPSLSEQTAPEAPGEPPTITPAEPADAPPAAENAPPEEPEAVTEQGPQPSRPSAPTSTARTETANPAPQTAPTSPRAPAQEPQRPATLNVLARPWADVRIDGRPLGATPLRNIEVRPGRHSLRLHCPPFDREASIPFEAEAGAVLQITAALDRDPPTIRVRSQ